MEKEISYIETEDRLTAKTVAKSWAGYGLQDLVFEFVMLDNWREYQPFFLEQGLEKICKAYLLPSRASEFENLTFEDAKHKIDEMATRCGHDLKKMIKKLKQIKPQLNNLLQKRYPVGCTGKEITTILKKGFIESRYVVPDPVSRNYPIKGTDMCWDPLYSSDLEHFVFEAASTILKYIAEDFQVEFPKRNSLPGKIKDNDWTRFCNLCPLPMSAHENEN